MSFIGSWNIHSTCDNHLIVKGQQLVALWCISLFLMIQSCVKCCNQLFWCQLDHPMLSCNYLWSSYALPRLKTTTKQCVMKEMSHLNFSGSWDNCLNCPASARIISSLWFCFHFENSLSLWHFKCGARYDKNMSACSVHWQECAVNKRGRWFCCLKTATTIIVFLSHLNTWSYAWQEKVRLFRLHKNKIKKKRAKWLTKMEDNSNLKTAMTNIVCCDIPTFIYLAHSTGQKLLPRGKGHKRTSMSHSKVPHLTHPSFTYERQPQHRDHPTLMRIVRGFFNVPQNYQHSRNCETGPPAYRPYPRTLESLTICRWNYKGSTFLLSVSKPFTVVIQPLSTRLIKPNFCFHHSHRRSTTVSLETRNPLTLEMSAF